MKIKQKLKWGILILLIGIFCTVFGALNNGVKSIAFDGIKPVVSDKEKQYSKTFENQKFDAIDIDVKRTKIRISQSDHYEITYCGKESNMPSIKIEDHKLMISQTNNVLTQIENTIHWKESKRINRNNSILKITVPRGVRLQNIKIFNNYGVTSIFDLNSAMLEATEMSGKIVLNRIKSEAVDLEASQGDGIYLNDIQAANGQIQNTQTSLNANKSNLSNIAFDSSNGDLNFNEGILNGNLINAKDGNVNLNEVKIQNNVTITNENGNNNINKIDASNYQLNVQNGKNQLFDQDQTAENKGKTLSKIQNNGNALSLTTTNGNNVVK